MILDVLKRHELRVQLWVTGGGGPVNAEDRRAAGSNRGRGERLRPIAERSGTIGCMVALYNHGGWFGEPENQIAIIQLLSLPNVGIVYNLHHGHGHLDRFPESMR